MVKARKVESSIRSRRSSAELAALRKKQIETAVTVFFGGLFLVTLWTIAKTCYHYPLFNLSWDNLDWSNAWLWATIVDYYGSTLCFAAIVLASSENWKVGLGWAAGFCLAGSPVCCVWILLRWRQTKSLRMEKVSEKKQDGSDSPASENQTLL